MPKINLPGLNRKKGSPEDLNFQCMDDGSVMSGCEETTNLHGLSDMLEAQRPQREKKSNAASSTVSVFQRLKTLGTRNKKSKSDDTVVTSFGGNDKLDEEEDEDSSSSSSSDDVYMYGKTQLPSTLVDLGNESSTDDDEDEALQFVPSKTTIRKSGAASVMAGSVSRRPVPSQSDMLRFMDAVPKKQMLSSASVMPSSNGAKVSRPSNGAKVSRPSLLAAPSGRGNFDAQLSPHTDDPTKAPRPSLLTAPSGRDDFVPHLSPRGDKVHGESSVMPASPSSNDEDTIPLPRPKLLPAPSNRGDMMDYVTPVRNPKPNVSTLPPLPTQEEGEENENELEINQNEQQIKEQEQEQQPQQQRRRPRRRGDGSLRGSGGSVAIADAAERQPRRRVASRLGDTNNNVANTVKEGEERRSDRPHRRRNAQGPSEVQNRHHDNINSNTTIDNTANNQEEGQESQPENESRSVPVPVTPGVTKQKMRRKIGNSNEDVPSSPRSTKGSPSPLPTPKKEEIRRRLRSSSSADTIETGPVESPIAASPRRRAPSKGTNEDSNFPGTQSERGPSKVRRQVQKSHASGNSSAKDPFPHSPKPRKPGSSPRKGAKTKLSNDSSLMYIFETVAQDAANQPKKPKESESVGGFLTAPPEKANTQNLRAQMLRAPSCSNFQMDAAVGKVGRPGKASRNLLGDHVDHNDITKPQKRSSATVTGHDMTDQMRRIDRRPKPKEKNMDEHASVVPTRATNESLVKKNGIKGTNLQKGETDDTRREVHTDEENEEDTKAMEKELLGFLGTQNQRGNPQASTSDGPPVADECQHDNGKASKGHSREGARRHSLSSVHKEENIQLDAKAPPGVLKEDGMEYFLESKRKAVGPKKRDAQSVIVGRSSNFHPKGPRLKSKTSDGLNLQGSQANMHGRLITKSTTHAGLTKKDLIVNQNKFMSVNGSTDEVNSYSEKYLSTVAGDVEEREVAAKTCQSETSRKKPNEGRTGRTDGAQPRRIQRTPVIVEKTCDTGVDQPRKGESRERDEGKPIQSNKKPIPSKSPRVRASNSRKPHRGSPTSVINAAPGASAGPRRNSLGSKIRSNDDRAPPARSKSDELLSLSSHHDDAGQAGVAAQLNFLPNNGNIGVKYNDVVSVLGESWRHM